MQWSDKVKLSTEQKIYFIVGVQEKAYTRIACMRLPEKKQYILVEEK